MGFIDSYKHLEKLCGEVLRSDRRVSAYIDEMLHTTNGSYYVRSWDDDLKKLKHYRWIRNQISHEPGCTEQNMCFPEDEIWLDEFYSRIMNQTDPLSLYHKATHSRHISKPVTKPIQSSAKYIPQRNSPEPTFDNIGCATIIIISSLLAIVGIVLLTQLRFL